MSYFKARSQQRINRPATWPVFLVQFLVTLVFALIGWFFAPNIGVSVMLGGTISIAALVFYRFQALRHFASPDTSRVILATFSAMIGKWVILVSACLIAVVKLEELNAGVLYLSAFVVHIVGALLLPVYVKRVAF